MKTVPDTFFCSFFCSPFVRARQILSLDESDTVRGWPEFLEMLRCLNVLLCQPPQAASVTTPPLDPVCFPAGSLLATALCHDRQPTERLRSPG